MSQSVNISALVTPQQKAIFNTECANCGTQMQIISEYCEAGRSTLFAQAVQPISELHRLFACHQSLSPLPEPVECSVEENLSAQLGADFWQLYTVNRWWQEEMMLSIIGVVHSESRKCKTQRADKPLQVSSCPVQFVELLALFLRNAPQGLVDNGDLSRFRTLFTPLLLAIQTYLEELKQHTDSAYSAIAQILEQPISIEEKGGNGKK